MTVDLDARTLLQILDIYAINNKIVFLSRSYHLTSILNRTIKGMSMTNVTSIKAKRLPKSESTPIPTLTDAIDQYRIAVNNHNKVSDELVKIQEVTKELHIEYQAKIDPYKIEYESKLKELEFVKAAFQLAQDNLHALVMGDVKA